MEDELKVEKLTVVTDGEWELVDRHNRRITEEFLEQAHLSPKTLNQYKSGLRQFFRWVYEECDNKPLYKLKPRDALRYQNFLINRGLAPKTVKFKRSCVSSLCGYMEIYYADDDNYMTFRNIYNKNIPTPPKATRREKIPLTHEEFNKLYRELRRRKEWQKIAYLMFTYSSGCRREESKQLLKEVADYETLPNKNYYATHKIRCKGRGREGKVRKLNFDEKAMKAIKKWLEIRGEDDCPYVFVSKTSKGVKQISEGTFNYWCETLFSKILKRNIHPHLIRATRATHMAIEGKDIKSAQQLLGHESPETTRIYVVLDDDEDLDQAFD